MHNFPSYNLERGNKTSWLPTRGDIPSRSVTLCSRDNHPGSSAPKCPSFLLLLKELNIKHARQRRARPLMRMGELKRARWKQRRIKKRQWMNDGLADHSLLPPCSHLDTALSDWQSSSNHGDEVSEVIQAVRLSFLLAVNSSALFRHTNKWAHLLVDVESL